MAEVGGQWPEHLIKIDRGSWLVQSGFMAMGKKDEQQDELFVPYSQMRSAGHPFYRALDGVLREHGFDRYAEELCARFYHPVMGRPGLAPRNYFRSPLVGYFEGIDSERGIGWAVAGWLTASPGTIRPRPIGRSFRENGGRYRAPRPVSAPGNENVRQPRHFGACTDSRALAATFVRSGRFEFGTVGSVRATGGQRLQAAVGSISRRVPSAVATRSSMSRVGS